MTATATVLVCRGCCCGTEKHADVDHQSQLDLLGEAARGLLVGGRMRITDCLGPCERSNVIAVRHRDLARPGVRTGTTWFGGVLEPADTGRLAAWIATGAQPADLSESLRALVFDPTEVQVTPDSEITFLDAATDGVIAS